MTSPAVSVCIPVYCGEQFLAETIRSVLAQTYRDFELFILDNASPDDTGRIARSFQDGRIRVETNSTVLPQPQNWRRAVERTWSKQGRSPTCWSRPFAATRAARSRRRR